MTDHYRGPAPPLGCRPSYLLPLTSYLLPLTSYLLPLTSYLLPLTYFTALFPRQNGHTDRRALARMLSASEPRRLVRGRGLPLPRPRSLRSCACSSKI